ncbi:hypothetical protein NA78x_003693 [Anatilimnocola sp. NA78]|uniref:hypothetical protein n=1 Tax=Anatilimnocola sp. NA78 TaxID=3415683 RepID=UPI003CE487C4
MDTMPNLRTALLDVLYETRSDDLKLIIGGGYGIFLKREYVVQAGNRTLFPEWPHPRSTNDLDLFLRPNLLIESQKLKPLSEALKRLGYEFIQGAEKYQFAKPGPTGGREGGLKIDILTGPRSRFGGTGAKVANRRVQPRPSVDLHAHPVDEALTLEDELLPLTLQGPISNGSPYQAVIYVPHPLTFAMMKLFAFRDRVHDRDKEFGSYHALDLYTVLAMMSEEEWNQAVNLRQQHSLDPMIEEAGRIVDQHFFSLISLGAIRIQESPYYRKELKLADFCSAIRDLFPLTLTKRVT